MNLPASNRRWISLAAVCLGAFSLVFLIPEAPEMKPSMLATELPRWSGDWTGETVAITGRELEILANDTSFERKNYRNFVDGPVPSVLVSIVFSGKDLNNSIHRPETCLRTQGWEFVEEGYTTVEDAFGGQAMPVKQIVCRRARLDDKGKPIVQPDGSLLFDWQLLQYTFVGHERVTPGHYGRTFIDIQDRLLRGHDQVWAYVTFATTITGKYADQGLSLGAMPAMDLEESREFLAGFIRSLMPRMIGAAGEKPPTG